LIDGVVNNKSILKGFKGNKHKYILIMAWVVETLKTGRLGQNPSLIDLKGELGVLYAGPLQDSLFFAHRMNSVWVHYQVVKSSRGIISSIDADDNASWFGLCGVY